MFGPASTRLVRTSSYVREEVLGQTTQTHRGPAQTTSRSWLDGRYRYTETVTRRTETPVTYTTVLRYQVTTYWYETSTPVYREWVTYRLTLYPDGRQSREYVGRSREAHPYRSVTRTWTETTVRTLGQTTRASWGSPAVRETRSVSSELVNRPPVAQFVTNSPVRRGEPVQFVDYSYDPDPGDALVARQWGGDKRSTYDRGGSYQVTLRVQDRQGAWSPPFTAVVRVLELGLEARVTPAVARRGQEVLLEARPDFPATRVEAILERGATVALTASGGVWTARYRVPLEAAEGPRVARFTGYLNSQTTSATAGYRVEGHIAESVRVALTD